MLLHQLGEHFILVSKLGFKLLDVFLLCLALRRRFLFKRGSTVFGELLLPSVENGWLMTVFIAPVRDWNPVDQMLLENENLLGSGVVFSLFACVESLWVIYPAACGGVLHEIS
jgi:hypothetical protein